MAEVLVHTERKAFFSVKSLAAYLEVSERHVKNLLAEGTLPSYRIGTARRIAADDVDTFLSHRRERRAA